MTTPNRNWSANEAREYCQWFIDSIERRIGNLFDYLEINGKSIKGRTAVHRVAAKLPAALIGNIDIAANVSKLIGNAPGAALAADAGLVVAHAAGAAPVSSLHWVVLRGRGVPKSLSSYNLPVLEGFDSGMPVDPIFSVWNLCKAALLGQVSIESAYSEYFEELCRRTQ